MKARDYPDRAREAIKEMHRQVGPLCFDERGLAKKGVLLRHLVMPSYVEESKKIMEFAAGVSKDTYVHIMEQYRPEFTVGKGERRARSGFTRYDEINRPVNDSEMAEVQSHAIQVRLFQFHLL